MAFTPRPYQVEAIDAAVDFLTDKKKKFNALEILPTGSGKSVVVANIVNKLVGKVIILQPSIEILKQNFAKFISVGGRAGIYSASAGMKFVDHVTFATIGSIDKKHHLFADVKYIIVDEAHTINSNAGMYMRFIKSCPNAKDLGTRLVKDKNAKHGVRPFSIREYARLQGFPDDFKFKEERNSYKLIGNAVAVPMGRWVGSEAMKYFN